MSERPSRLCDHRFVLLAAICLVAVAVRLHGIHLSLWFDELCTYWSVDGGLGEITERSLATNHLPTFSYLAWLSVGCLGKSEIAVRLPSLLAGVLLVPVVFVTARRITGSRGAALLAAFLAATDSLCIMFGTTAREYSFVQLVSLIHIAAFWELMSAPSGRRRLAFVATLVAMFYLHITSVAIVMGEIAFYAAMLCRRGKSRYRPGQFLADLVVAGLLCTPVLPYVLVMAGKRHAMDVVLEHSFQLQDILILYPIHVYIVYPLLAAGFVCFALRSAGAQPGERPTGRAEALAFLGCLFFVPSVVLWIVSRAGIAPLFHVWYTTPLIVLPILASALVWSWIPGRAGRVVFALVAVGLMQASEGPVRRYLAGQVSARPQKEDWKDAMAYLNANDSDAALPLFIRAGFCETDDDLAREPPGSLARRLLTEPFVCMYPLEHPQRPIRALSYNGSLADEQQVAEVRRAGGAWFLVKTSPRHAERIAQRAIDRLRQEGMDLEVADMLANEHVALFRLRDASSQ